MPKQTSAVDSALVTPCIFRLARPLGLACAALLPGAGALAQPSTSPILTPVQTLAPTEQETYPTPGSYPYDLIFGGSLAVNDHTILASMSRYNNETGRIAVFDKAPNGQWVRTGSIDPTPQIEYDYFGGMWKLDHDYLMAGAGTGTFIFHRIHGTWVQTDKLNGVIAWGDAGQTIDPPWAFVVGDVYRITPEGQMVKTGQTLSDSVPPGLTSFGGTEAADGETLAIADVSYNNDQGTVFVYNHEHGQWVQKQQLVAADGVPSDVFGDGIALSGDLMAITASGRNLRYEDPNCPGTYYTGGSVYLFKRIEGVWKQQEELNAQCVSYGVQVDISREWLALGTGGQGIVFHRTREKGPNMFVPFGQTDPTITGFTMKMSGHTMAISTGADEEFPPGAVYVYDLEAKEKDEDH